MVKILRIVHAAVIAAALILEALPYGAVLCFAAPEINGSIRQTFSYFDLTPFGYANFGPLATAAATVLIAVQVLISCFGKHRPKLCRSIGAVSAAAVIFSLAPLMFGIDFYSLVGLFITLLLTASAALGFVRAKSNEK